MIFSVSFFLSLSLSGRLLLLLLLSDLAAVSPVRLFRIGFQWKPLGFFIISIGGVTRAIELCDDRFFGAFFVLLSSN
jgi:hypothetical protein